MINFFEHNLNWVLWGRAKKFLLKHSAFILHIVLGLFSKSLVKQIKQVGGLCLSSVWY